MNSVRELLTEVLKDIVPTESELELIEKIVEKVKKLLDQKAKEIHVEYKIIEPQGSTGIKQTQLKNDFDIDIFVGLPFDSNNLQYKQMSKNQLKKEAKKDFLKLCKEWIVRALVGKEFKNPQILYAEHPYVQIEYNTPELATDLDIVLYFELSLDHIVKHGPITAVDRSPWHGRFVRDNLTSDQKNDVRLLKQFFKACHSYGDKSAVGKMGFIGYSAELLIYHFKDLMTLFKNFQDLPKHPLDYYNRPLKELLNITHFQNDFLILTDPTDLNRNVASAIAEQAFKYCNYKIGQFLISPSKDYFEIKPLPEANLHDTSNPLRTKVFVIEFESTSDETHYTIFRDKLYSLGESIKANGEKEFSHAERFGSIIFEVYFEDRFKHYCMAIYCEKTTISETYQRKGPKLTDKLHCQKFKEKNPIFFEKNGYLWVDSRRDFTDFSSFLKSFVSDKIPDNLSIINLSEAIHTKTSTGKKAIYVLETMILPFYL